MVSAMMETTDAQETVSVAAETTPQEQPPLQALMDEALDLHRANRLEEAEHVYRDILAQSPGFAPAWINLGVLMRRRGQLEPAVLYLRRGLALRPDDGPSWSNLGNALRALGRLKDAEFAHRRALELSAERPETHYNLGLCLRDRGMLDMAGQAFRRATLLGYEGPDLAWDECLNHLLAGDLREGFGRYDSRWSLPQSPPQHVGIPSWDGAEMSGRLLVYAEQGLGDSLQFCRYLPMVKERVGEVTFECQPQLFRLLKSSPAFDGVEFIARGLDPLPEVEAAAALLSLPHLCGTHDEADIPATPPYLVPPKTNIPVIRKTDTGRRRIGLVWAGKPSHNNDRNRSARLDLFAPLFDIPGCHFLSLQMGDAAAQVENFELAPVLQDLTPHIRDFADTAALIQDLDLVITVDTSTAHLAGALDKPVWVMLPFAPDWRWQLHRSDSPWYPSMTLFRQSSPGDWTEVMDRLRAHLHQFIRKEKPEP